MLKVQINLGVEAQTLSERDHAFSRDRHGYGRRDLGRDEFYYTKVLQRIGSQDDQPKEVGDTCDALRTGITRDRTRGKHKPNAAKKLPPACEPTTT